MQGRFLGNSGESNPEIWDAANIRFCLREHKCSRNPAPKAIIATCKVSFTHKNCG